MTAPVDRAVLGPSQVVVHDEPMHTSRDLLAHPLDGLGVSSPLCLVAGMDSLRRVSAHLIPSFVGWWIWKAANLHDPTRGSHDPLRQGMTVPEDSAELDLATQPLRRREEERLCLGHCLQTMHTSRALLTHTHDSLGVSSPQSQAGSGRLPSAMIPPVARTIHEARNDGTSRQQNWT